eukprot:m.338406 g.338406  ORF g.338406 m.338406 type:complete len:369 (+) comp18404_c0_seq1:278-1384(+)
MNFSTSFTTEVWGLPTNVSNTTTAVATTELPVKKQLSEFYHADNVVVWIQMSVALIVLVPVSLALYVLLRSRRYRKLQRERVTMGLLLASVFHLVTIGYPERALNVRKENMCVYNGLLFGATFVELAYMAFIVAVLWCGLSYRTEIKRQKELIFHLGCVCIFVTITMSFSVPCSNFMSECEGYNQTKYNYERCTVFLERFHYFSLTWVLFLGIILFVYTLLILKYRRVERRYRRQEEAVLMLGDEKERETEMSQTKGALAVYSLIVRPLRQLPMVFGFFAIIGLLPAIKQCYIDDPNCRSAFKIIEPLRSLAVSLDYLLQRENFQALLEISGGSVPTQKEEIFSLDDEEESEEAPYVLYEDKNNLLHF